MAQILAPVADELTPNHLAGRHPSDGGYLAINIARSNTDT